MRYDITSICTKKTVRFTNSIGHFTYLHAAPEAFRGFKIVKDQNGLDVFMAEPEKAVVDFLYFMFGRDPKAKEQSQDVFSESYRFEDVGTLKEKRILELAALFHNTNLTAMANLFCKFRKEYV